MFRFYIINPVSFFLAHRYLASISKKQSLRTLLICCFLSITLASATFALAIGVMNSLERATYKKLQGMHADIFMKTTDGAIDLDALETVLKTIPEVSAYSPIQTEQVLIQNSENDELPTVIALKGIDPLKEQSITNVHNYIVSKQKEKVLNRLHLKNNIIVGSKVAQHLSLLPGQTVSLFVPSAKQHKKTNIKLTEISATIAGIFTTGVEEIDASLGICSLTFLQKLFPENEISTIQAKLHNQKTAPQTIETLKNKTGLDVYSWQDLYPGLVSAFALQKYATLAILMLFALLASITLMALIFTLVFYKQRDQAILFAMGLSKRNIATIFMLIGAAISTTASITGIGLAILTNAITYWYPIPLPEAYCAETLTITIEPYTAISIVCSFVMLGFIASILPIKTINHSIIISTLRSE